MAPGECTAPSQWLLSLSVAAVQGLGGNSQPLFVAPSRLSRSTRPKFDVRPACLWPVTAQALQDPHCWERVSVSRPYHRQAAGLPSNARTELTDGAVCVPHTPTLAPRPSAPPRRVGPPRSIVKSRLCHGPQAHSFFCLFSFLVLGHPELFGRIRRIPGKYTW